MEKLVRVTSALICYLTLLATIGCSEAPTRFPVAGKVLIDGEPLTMGSIQFVPAKGRPYASKIGKDGSFRLAEHSVSGTSSLRGVAAGEYKLGISSKEVVNEDAGEVLKHIPGHYADYQTSDLVMVIAEPKEDLVIELTWEGSQEISDSELEKTPSDEVKPESEAHIEGDESTGSKSGTEALLEE